MSGRGKRVAREVFHTLVQHPDVILDTNTAERPQRVDRARIDQFLAGSACKPVEELVDEVNAGLDRQHLVPFQCSRQPEERVSRRSFDDIAVIVRHESGDIVDLYTKEVSESVREKGRSDPFDDQGLLAAFRETKFPEQRCDTGVRRNMQIAVIHAGTYLADDVALHRIQAVDKIGERSAARRVGPSDVCRVSIYDGPGVNQERADFRWCLPGLMLVVQHGGVLV